MTFKPISQMHLLNRIKEHQHLLNGTLCISQMFIFFQPGNKRLTSVKENILSIPKAV